MLVSVFGVGCQGGKPMILVDKTTSNSGYNVPKEAGVSVPIASADDIDGGCAQSITRGQLRQSNLLFLIDRSLTCQTWIRC